MYLFVGVRIKEERPDEAEIQELAARMVEANKAKMAAQAAAAANPPPKPRYPNQGILGYTSSSPRPNSRNTPTSPSPSSTPAKEKAPTYICSQKGTEFSICFCLLCKCLLTFHDTNYIFL